MSEVGTPSWSYKIYIFILSLNKCHSYCMNTTYFTAAHCVNMSIILQYNHHHHHHHHRRNPKPVNCNLNSTLQVRNEATAAGSAPARESIWHYFVNKCANNLHVVLAMSPVGDTLRTRCRNFPGMPLFSYFTSHHHNFGVFECSWNNSFHLRNATKYSGTTFKDFLKEKRSKSK